MKIFIEFFLLDWDLALSMSHPKKKKENIIILYNISWADSIRKQNNILQFGYFVIPFHLKNKQQLLKCWAESFLQCFCLLLSTLSFAQLLIIFYPAVIRCEIFYSSQKFSRACCHTAAAHLCHQCCVLKEGPWQWRSARLFLLCGGKLASCVWCLFANVLLCDSCFSSAS